VQLKLLFADLKNFTSQEIGYHLQNTFAKKYFVFNRLFSRLWRPKRQKTAGSFSLFRF